MAITFSVMADTSSELMGFLSSLAASGFTGKMAAPVSPVHVPQVNRALPDRVDTAVEQPVEQPLEPCVVHHEPYDIPATPAPTVQPRRRRTKAEMEQDRLAQQQAAESYPLQEVCDAAQDQADKDLAHSAPKAAVPAAHTHAAHKPSGAAHTQAPRAMAYEEITAKVREAQKSMPLSEVVSYIRACGYGAVSQMPAEAYSELAARLEARLAEIAALNAVK